MKQKPMICHRCHKLVGTARICPHCFAIQPRRSVGFMSPLKQFIRSWQKRAWQNDLSSRILTITVIMFFIQSITTLVFSPSSFLSALFRGPPGGIILTLGASSPLVFQGSWWAPLTAIFLHGGIVHLGFNMMALSFISHTIERNTSPWFMVLTYLVSGAIGFILSAALGNFSVGASGALFGLIGCGMVLAFIFGSGRYDPLFILLMNWAIMGILFGALVPGVDNSAHLGGLAAGAGCGWCWTRGQHLRVFRKLVMWFGFLLALITAIGWISSVHIQLPLLLKAQSLQSPTTSAYHLIIENPDAPSDNTSFT